MTARMPMFLTAACLIACVPSGPGLPVLDPEETYMVTIAQLERQNSRNPNDAHYEVFNSSVHLAGQLQRISTWAADTLLKERLADRAARIMGILATQARTTTGGSINWSYGTAENSALNDLLHASYIAEGIREYQRYGSDRSIDIVQVMAHFDDFGRAGYWYEHSDPTWRQDPFETRLWTLGQLMYTLAREGREEEARATLWPQLCQYHLGGGRFRLKRNDERALVRQEAHVQLGESHFLFGPAYNGIGPVREAEVPV